MTGGQNTTNVTNLLMLSSALLNGIFNAFQANAGVQELVAKMQSEGRDTMTDEEWAVADRAQAAADALLAAAVSPDAPAAAG